MSILTYPLGFLGGGDDEFYNGVIENSLRFENAVNTELIGKSVTASPGTTSTTSWWCKKSKTGITQAMVGAGLSQSSRNSFIDFPISSGDIS